MTIQAKPKVSVVIPTYNQEQLINVALDSIPKRKDIEVICIDDGSTDASLKAMRGHPRADVILCNTINQGVADTVNKGYDIATGEYVVVLDSDDFFYTNAFEQAMDELDGTDLVYFNLKVNSGGIWHLTPNSKRLWCGAVKFIRREFLGATRCPAGMRRTEDWFLNEELLKKNPTEKYTNLVVKHYNFPRENSLTWLGGNGEREE